MTGQWSSGKQRLQGKEKKEERSSFSDLFVSGRRKTLAWKWLQRGYCTKNLFAIALLASRLPQLHVDVVCVEGNNLSANTCKLLTQQYWNCTSTTQIKKLLPWRWALSISGLHHTFSSFITTQKVNSTIYANHKRQEHCPKDQSKEVLSVAPFLQKNFT